MLSKIATCSFPRGLEIDDLYEKYRDNFKEVNAMSLFVKMGQKKSFISLKMLRRNLPTKYSYPRFDFLVYKILKTYRRILFFVSEVASLNRKNNDPIGPCCLTRRSQSIFLLKKKTSKSFDSVLQTRNSF